MSELKKILAAVKSALEKQGIETMVYDFPNGEKPGYTVPVAAIGLKGASGLNSGFYEYLGEKAGVDGGKSAEIYGKRLELTLSLRVYSPEKEAGADGCLRALDRIIGGIEDIPGGIRITEFSAGETKYDRATDMFLITAAVKLSVYLYAERTEDGEFLDFNLKGELK